MQSSISSAVSYISDKWVVLKLQVQQDIVHSLHLNNPAMLMTSFNRPNIRYQVELLDLMQQPAAVGALGGATLEEGEEGGPGAALREKAGEFEGMCT